MESLERMIHKQNMEDKYSEYLLELDTYVRGICRLEENTEYLEKLINKCRKKRKKLKYKIIKKISKKII